MPAAVLEVVFFPFKVDSYPFFTMMQGLTSAIVNPNDLRLMETIKSCDVIKNNTLYADSYLEL